MSRKVLFHYDNHQTALASLIRSQKKLGFQPVKEVICIEVTFFNTCTRETAS
jgi:hypothetical protein